MRQLAFDLSRILFTGKNYSVIKQDSMNEQSEKNKQSELWTYEQLIHELEKFSAEREWQQFHTPKNLSMALSVEVAELMEIFQWLDGEQSKKLSPEQLEHLKEEIGDVQLYLCNLANQFGINCLEAAQNKMAKNALKYPADQAQGKADKYTAYLKK